jgi:hypothetical protein
MKIFLSHASQDKTAADSIAFSLRGRGHKVFVDRDDLPPGESYDQQIGRAVRDSEIFIFLISPDSVADGRYTLTELAFARRKWSNPSRRVLPVMARKTPLEQVPSYLGAVTILEPVGNITAETSAAVDDMGRRSFARGIALRFAVVGAVSGVICSFLPIFTLLSVFGFTSPPADVGVVFGVFITATIYKYTSIKSWRRLLWVPTVVVPLWLITADVTLTFTPGRDDATEVAGESLKTLDESVRKQIEDALEAQNTIGDAYHQITFIGKIGVVGVFFNLVLLISLRYILRISSSLVDYGWSVGLGFLGGVIFAIFLSGALRSPPPWKYLG